MNLDDVIMQLRTYCPVFNGNVAGAADFENGLPISAHTQLPAAFVIPESDTAGPNTQMTGANQTVTETISVYIEIDNSADRRGQGAADAVDTLKRDVHKALYNWKNLNDPKLSARGLYFAGADRAKMDGQRLYWVMKYSRDITLTAEDGFVPPSELLVEIDGISATGTVLTSATNLQNAVGYANTYI